MPRTGFFNSRIMLKCFSKSRAHGKMGNDPTAVIHRLSYQDQRCCKILLSFCKPGLAKRAGFNSPPADKGSLKGNNNHGFLRTANPAHVHNFIPNSLEFFHLYPHLNVLSFRKSRDSCFQRILKSIIKQY